MTYDSKALRCAALGLLLLAPSAAIAQSTTFNLGGGLALANSGFGNRNESGYSLIVGVGMTQRGSPIAFRAEGMYNAFNQKVAGGTATVGGITGNATYDFSVGGGAFTPYGIAGIGYFSTKEPSRFADVSSQTNVGWNVGGGIRFPLTGFSAYFEARYFSISNAGIVFTPIVFGVSFP